MTNVKAYVELNMRAYLFMISVSTKAAAGRLTSPPSQSSFLLCMLTCYVISCMGTISLHFLAPLLLTDTFAEVLMHWIVFICSILIWNIFSLLDLHFACAEFILLQFPFCCSVQCSIIIVVIIIIVIPLRALSVKLWKFWIFVFVLSYYFFLQPIAHLYL